MDVRWYGVDLVSGGVLEELPIQVSGALSHRLGAYSSASATLALPPAPTGWEAATEPRRTMIVLALDDTVVWGGRVVTRDGGTDATVSLGLSTLESYLDHRFVGNHGWVNQDEASVIAAGLIGDANTVEGIGLTVSAPATGTLRDRTYLDQDDKSVYSALQELMGVEGGPEWTIELAWADPADRTTVSKTFKVRERIGYAQPEPAAIFQAQGEASARYTLAEDHSSGKGGNHVVAVSSGEGDTRPQSVPARDETLLAIEPRYEHRFTPSTSITTQSVLDAHARSKLALIAPGGRVVKVTARFDAYPRLGVDWAAGDDIAYELIGHRHLDGFSGIARCIGWELDLAQGQVTPMLLVPGEEVS